MMKRFEDLVVGDFAGMTAMQIADYIERVAQPSHSLQDIYKRAEEIANDIKNLNYD